MAERPSSGTTIVIVRSNGGPTLISNIPLAELEFEFSPAMTHAQLQEIPKVTITKEHTDSLIPCTVCLDAFELNDGEIRKLPCSHMYHELCIFRWLKSNPTCPSCRAPLSNTNRNRNNHLLGDIIREHYVSLFRRAVRQRELPLESQASEAESTTAPTRQHETLQVGRDVPRRAAALLARRAIQQIWRRPARNRQTRGRTNLLQNGPH